MERQPNQDEDRGEERRLEIFYWENEEGQNSEEKTRSASKTCTDMFSNLARSLNLLRLIRLRNRSQNLIFYLERLEDD